MRRLDQEDVGMMDSMRSPVVLVIVYALSFSVAIRGVFGPCVEWCPRTVLWLVFGLQLVLLTWSLFLRHTTRWLSPYFLAQTAIVVFLSWTIRKENMSILFIPLCIQAVMLLSRREGLQWILGFTVVMVVLQFELYGVPMGLASSFTYGAAFLFVGSYSFLLAKERESAQQSHTLLLELRQAYAQLKEHASQAEELAASAERNAIARELHDSATQMLFAISILSKTALMLLDKQPEKLRSHLEQLQQLAQDALSEMRHLIAQLRPGGQSKKGLLPAIQQHVDFLERQHALRVVLEAEDEPALSNEQAHKLFRITQEALNNIIKYAGVEEAFVRLQVDEDKCVLSIEDEGVGFDEEKLTLAEESMGLSSMRERAALMGADFFLSSAPGKGTLIRVTLGYCKKKRV
ncbi:MAG TPA: hypothetical protein DCE42_15420 [Myxococcales bacterium]|nr:hypothetical protein [Deltaproteobacteria bacterium]HAA56153.1 hypothetical protein [Myxococcales bacterium]|tara:strand:- start:4284 stop:5495 length:1212 start_codon:yes stop_codon:yes gene_type:complete